ncbi:PHP domain-containing protein [Proteinivorax tanatarense]|uniref:PHP domain-containing protein n=1 Tax=Proteinivorax tanatarense TaxID=1260629 RepID=A0AAU7VP25_9FIRM
MDNIEVSTILKDIGIYIQLTGENPYKGKSYIKAARTLARANPLSEIIAKNQLTDLPGIGDRLAKEIIDITERGESTKLIKLKKEVPSGLKALTYVTAITPGMAYKLYHNLEVENIRDLLEVIESRKIYKVEGVGDSTVKKIRQSLEDYILKGRQFLLSDGKILYNKVMFKLQFSFNNDAINSVGDFRRNLKLISKIEILVTCTKNVLEKALRESFNDVSAKEKYFEINDYEIPVVIYYCQGKDTGYNLLIKTGNVRHVEELKVAGLSKAKVEKMNEQEIYESLSMQFVPPELREGKKEVSLAKDFKLPKLVRVEDIKGDLHVHTNFSDGLGSLEEMVGKANMIGYDYLAITDHSKSLKIAGGLNKDKFYKQFKEIENIQKDTDILILKGIEVDVLKDGSLDFDEDFLKEFDLVVASIHSNFKMPKEHMTNRLISAIRNPAVHIIGHPSGRLLLKREPYNIDLKAVIEEASSYNKAIEINSSPYRLDLDEEWVRFAKQSGVKISVNTDSHSIEELYNIDLGVSVAKRGWLERKDIINCWKKEKLLGYLRR